MQQLRRYGSRVGTGALLLLILVTGMFPGGASPRAASAATAAPAGSAADKAIRGPIVGEAPMPNVWNGDLRDLPQIAPDKSKGAPEEPGQMPEPANQLGAGYQDP